MFAAAAIVNQNLVLNFILDKLQRRELVLDSSTSPVSFEPLNTLLIFISSFESYNFLDMKENSYYLLLNLFL